METQEATSDRCAATDAPPWTLQYWPTVDSTNLRAVGLPAWSAVLAGAQTMGRGRHGRPWNSEPGGLWLSAVLPCPAPRARWAILPLAAGWAVMRSLAELGVGELRLRWPNDVMSGRRKLAGLLVERFEPETAVVGIGLNVFNDPGAANAELVNTTARLADLVPLPGSLFDLTERVLRTLRLAHCTLASGSFDGIVADLNRSCFSNRRIALHLREARTAIEGEFCGIDDHGRLRVDVDGLGRCVYDAGHVIQLRELD